MKWLAPLLLLALIVVWGANWPILKIGLAYISPLWLAALRLVMAVALLFAALALIRGRTPLPHRDDLPLVASVGVFQIAGFTILINLGLAQVEAGRSAILAYTTPLWVAPGAALFLGERLTPVRLAGVALGLLGVVVLFGPWSFDWGDGGALFGNAMLMLAALAWAVAILHVRGHRWKSDALDLMPWQALVGAAISVAVAIGVDGPLAARWTPTFWAILIYNGTLATAFGLWAVITVTRLLPAVTSSLSFMGVPVAGLAFSAWWLDEPMGWQKLLALALVVAGIATVSLSRNAGEGR